MSLCVLEISDHMWRGPILQITVSISRLLLKSLSNHMGAGSTLQLPQQSSLRRNSWKSFHPSMTCWQRFMGTTAFRILLCVLQHVDRRSRQVRGYLILFKETLSFNNWRWIEVCRNTLRPVSVRGRRNVMSSKDLATNPNIPSYAIVLVLPTTWVQNASPTGDEGLSRCSFAHLQASCAAVVYVFMSRKWDVCSFQRSHCTVVMCFLHVNLTMS